MATILEFRRAAGPTSRVAELKDGVPGQIIIFPGVRIERHEGETPPPEGSEPGSGDYDGVGGKRRPRKSS